MGDRALDRNRSLESPLSWRSPLPVLRGLGRLCVLTAIGLIASGPMAVAQEQPSANEPIERRAYRISLHLAFDLSTRIDDAERAELIRAWQILARRFVGAPWVVSFAPATSALSNANLDSLEPEAFAGSTSFDKFWVIRVGLPETGAGLVFTGREFDAATKRVGPRQARYVSTLLDAPRALLQFSRDLFNPTAVVTGQEGGRALLTVQGSMIAPASPAGAVVEKGTVFQPLRLVSLAGGKVQVSKIKHTYLQTESIEGPIARCAIITGLRDPLSNRMARPNSIAALGLKPGNTPLALRFVTGPDKAPAAGYTLTARLVPDGQARDLGTTDRSGRIVLKPGFARGLVILRLVAGSTEPIVELPVMPGESSDELLISVDLKPLTIALEAQLESLRDEVIDLVALRARLETRMKARLEGEDWSGLALELKEYETLAPRDQFVQRLARLKDDAASTQAKLKTAVLTKTAQAQITELQSMIDRYLDDDSWKAYSEALDKGRSEVAAKTKAQSKKKAEASPSAAKQAAPARDAAGSSRPAGAPPSARPRPKAGHPPLPPGQPF